MSVQKLHPAFENGTMTKESKPYTQISNNVLQNCTNIKALGLWCYLQSLPEGWELNPHQLKNHFGVYKNGIYELLNYLIDHELLIRHRNVDENGVVISTTYTVLNGEKSFINQDSNPLPYFPEVDNPEVENRDIINKRININKIKRTNKRVWPKKKATPTQEKKKFLCPLDFKPNESHYQFGKELGVDVNKEAPAMIDWSHSQGKKALNWNRTFNNWIRNDHKFQLSRSKNKGDAKHGDAHKETPTERINRLCGIAGRGKRKREQDERTIVLDQADFCRV